MSPKRIPEHVPERLFWNHSYAEFTGDGDDPFLAASRLHEGPDIVWARELFYGEPGWILTRRAHMQEVFSDADRFSSRGSLFDPLGLGPLIPLECDPPVHHAYRTILAPFFTPSRVAALEPMVRDVCDSLLVDLAGRDSCEFIGDFADKFPSFIFLDLMGMPREMLSEFLGWERTMLRGEDPVERLNAMKSILGYLEAFLREQREDPRTDLVEGLFAARYGDVRPLQDAEILNMCFVLFIGGLDTVYSTLGWIFRHLAGDPMLQAKLRADPASLPSAVEEFLRAYSVATSQRRAKTDLVFHGVTMRASDVLQLSLPLAGRDPKAYEHPHSIDLERRAPHLAFGTGPHSCIGLHLARLEIRTVLRAFLSRFDDIRIPCGERCSYHVGNVFGVDRLPIAWNPATPAG